jgi:hypothetical protein
MTGGVERTLLFYHSIAAIVNGNFAVIGDYSGVELRWRTPPAADADWNGAAFSGR